MKGTRPIMTIDCNSNPSTLSDEDFLGFAHAMTRELKLMARERGFHQLAPSLTSAEEASRKLCDMLRRRQQQQQQAATRRVPAHTQHPVTPAKAGAHG
jgi:hypothetical protein